MKVLAVEYIRGGGGKGSGGGKEEGGRNNPSNGYTVANPTDGGMDAETS